MSDDEDYSDVDVPPFDAAPIDPVAARAASFTKLLALVDHVRDDEAKKEALLMLRAIRLSFKTIPVGDLSSLPGGKTS
jgi:molybdopterin biosynthesis enzyme